MTSTHSYWIPTNRLVHKSLSSYVDELKYWHEVTGEVIPVFVLDSGNAQIESANARSVQEISQQVPQLSIQHIPFHVQREQVRRIVRHAGLSMSHLDDFVPSGTNYGAVMNRIALFAAALGSDCIHRRDSDTQLQENCPFPLETEMLSLRGSLSLAATGSGYVGEWNMDLKPFLNAAPESFNTFWRCLGVDADLHDTIYATLDDGSRDYYSTDAIAFTDKNGFNLPDAGNVAFSKFYQRLPSLPSNAMSSDYMLFRFARGCDVPVMFHRRRVVHEYHNERKSHLDGYLTSLMKYVDLRPIYSALESTMRENKCSQMSDTDVQYWVADALARLIEADIDERTARLARFENEFIACRYPGWAAAAGVSAESILTDCLADYYRHIKLTANWNTLMRAAAEQGVCEGPMVHHYNAQP